jgi:intracellular multiplication protein IcmK
MSARWKYGAVMLVLSLTAHAQPAVQGPERAAPGPEKAAIAVPPGPSTSTPQSGPAYQSPSLPPLPGQASPSRQALDEALPVTREDVMELRRRVDELQRAQSVPPKGPAPKPVSGSISISQSPGETPPLVRLAVGHVTSIVFTDATGAPWPVAIAIPGDKTRFQISIPTKDSPTVEINQLTAYPYGNVNVTLKDNPIPVSLTLVSGQKEVDARLDVRIMRRGPQAAALIIDRALPEIADKVLGTILDGVPPDGAKFLKSSLPGVAAWKVDKRIYVRTKLTLLSPAWTGFVSSADGTNVYEVTDTPVLLVSVEGRSRSVALGD